MSFINISGLTFIYFLYKSLYNKFCHSLIFLYYHLINPFPFCHSSNHFLFVIHLLHQYYHSITRSLNNLSHAQQGSLSFSFSHNQTHCIYNQKQNNKSFNFIVHLCTKRAFTIHNHKARKEKKCLEKKYVYKIRNLSNIQYKIIKKEHKWTKLWRIKCSPQFAHFSWHHKLFMTNELIFMTFTTIHIQPVSPPFTLFQRFNTRLSSYQLA